jgi:hypothetical protein
MKKILLGIEVLKNYLLQLSLPKKIFLAAILSFLFTLFFVKHSFFSGEIRNVFNFQTVISAINVGNANNEVIFKSNDKNLEIENNAQWFKNAEGQIGSVVVIKDVGSVWKRKNLEAEIIGDGEIIIKLSGIYEKFPDSPTIFVSYQNFKINGKEISIGTSDGRNDKDTLIFKFPVKNGQKLEISIEYRNAINYFTLLKMVCIALIFLPVFFIFYFLLRVFKSQNQTRIICKFIIGLFILVWIYFIFLGDFFPKEQDEFLQTLPTTAMGKDGFINLASLSRFWPLGTSYYNLLRLLPYGYTPQAHYFLNILIFVGFILLFLKILKFNSAQSSVELYLKTFLVCCLVFITITEVWLELMPFFGVIYAETLLCFLFALFVFCYQKMTALNEIIDDHDVLNNSYAIKGEARWDIPLIQERMCWAVLAVIIAVFSTYCKEPVFIVFFIIACVNLLLSKRPLQRFNKIFNCILIVNAICFMGIYYFRVFLHKNIVYGQADMNLASFQLDDILKWFGVEPIIFLCGAFIIIRLYVILFKKDRRHIFYDGILFGAFGYCAIIIALRLPLYGYYFLPPFVLFFVVLAYWLIKFYDLKKYVIFLLISFSVFSWSMDGLVTLVDIFIKQHFLVLKRPVAYNVLKLDMLLKYNKIVDDGNIRYDNSDTQLLFFSLINTLKYFNSNYFYPKILDDSSIRGRLDSLYIEKFTQNERIYSKNIYISFDKNLAVNNKNFLDFILIAKLNLFGGTLYAYAHKDRL